MTSRGLRWENQVPGTILYVRLSVQICLASTRHRLISHSTGCDFSSHAHTLFMHIPAIVGASQDVQSKAGHASQCNISARSRVCMCHGSEPVKDIFQESCEKINA